MEEKSHKNMPTKHHQHTIPNTFFMLVGVAFVLLFINQLTFVTIIAKGSGTTTSLPDTSSASSTISVIPTGVPAVYGAELGISYDDVSPADPQKADATIAVLGRLDQTLSLEGDDLTRYISIASNISCEYCCGAESIIFSNGQAACGCAHSYAMRGLAKYLILNHPDLSDRYILEELGKWKTLFFPSQITAKATILQENGIELNYINLASNAYRGIEKGSGGGMVGGC